ncbi:N-acetylmuramoyl-L-alanine amidase [Romboutsia sedimentorum]|uniref:N-acetylmuramoyl-L-alanine amidase n=1 Tax=Romboutsia sedimentorum TaxID=1368474 RepID=A0ABT7EAT4_9FIRM|nr:N-acetylmuramoyl-L-alanine amidase [Romboutsia sedimentorum]MDK2562615.1 N-acetylmuramoyl-L-alanine amidase [Romboutsia sedimentorum]MDK2584857.1 N-acetylmuramoyl-L-alanine amidase [Romboutsia sedimentorum]
MSKKVFIDPGHGGKDSGAIGVNNLLEKTINLQVAKKVDSLLKKQGLDVKLSRDSDIFLSLNDRTTIANNWKADCFVSIHCNAFDGIAKGIETFAYKSNTSDLATKVHHQVLNTGAYTLNRGVKTASFYVLRNTAMRACLIELAFIDNVEDSKILTQRQDDLALGIAKGVCEYLGIEYKPNHELPDIKPPVVDSDTFYRVVCGSFNNKVYAEERLEELKKLGFDDAFITVFKKEGN